MDLNLATAVVGAATAVGTVLMAFATYIHIRQEKRQHRESIQEGKRQHMDQLKPICALVPYGGVDPLNKRGVLVNKVSPAADNPSFGTLQIHCTLQNVGGGPAMNLRIKFKFLDMEGWTTKPWELSPLGAGETCGGSGNPLLVPIWIHERFNSTEFDMVTNKLWEIWLEYEDMFGNKFSTVHHKVPQEPWVTFQ